MLSENKLDIVHVCTANGTHKEFTIAALKSGANVLCEKPLALSLADAREMFAAADEAGKLLVACQNNRFGPVQEIKRLYGEGELGEVYFAEIVSEGTRGAPPWGRFHIAKENGHGAMCDVGVHFLDAMMFILGNPAFKSASASAYLKIANTDKSAGNAGMPGKDGERPYLPRGDFDYHDVDVEDFFTGRILFENGLVITLSFAWSVSLPGRDYYRIAGTKAGLTYTKHLNLDDPISVHRIEKGELKSRVIELPIKGHMFEHGHPMLIEHFADVLQNGKECIIRREEMLNVSAMLQALYLSAELGREVAAGEIKEEQR
jgi:predicted dehydrogenase